MRLVNVQLAERSYPIRIGAGLLDNTQPIIDYCAGNVVAIVSNETVWPQYGQALQARLRAMGKKCLPIILPDGEAYKTQVTLDIIFDALLENKCDRKTTLIALGGGVVGDIAGFAAACYLRGIAFIQIPTTLLSQVDSSVGGKTAINHPLGKNMIGAFYQPKLVLIDPKVLSTLPDRELKAGIAEIIKYGIALDVPFFNWLEANIGALLGRNADALSYAIQRSCEIKAGIVKDDERETASEGGRALLNLGHTFGHAIEAAMGYGVWLHGEAVAAGCCYAARLSAQLGFLDHKNCDRIQQLFLVAGLPISAPTIAPSEMLEHMSRDKKNESGVIRLILLKALGEAYIDAQISLDQISNVLIAQRSA